MALGLKPDSCLYIENKRDLSFIGKDFKFQSGTGYKPPRRILLWSFLKIADNLKAKPGMLFLDAKEIISGYSFSLKLKITFLNSLDALWCSEICINAKILLPAWSDFNLKINLSETVFNLKS